MSRAINSSSFVGTTNTRVAAPGSEISASTPTAAAFRALTDASIALGGGFFLTYHRHASAAQVEAAYPRFRAFLQHKRALDPHERFTSDWYRHYRDAFAALTP